MASATSSWESRSTSAVHWFHHPAPALILVGLLISVAAGKYGGGSGIQTDPYLIRTVEDLRLLGDTQADWDKSFRLMADLDLKDCNETNFHLIGHWVSAGAAQNKPFSGSFDGNGRTISNFHYRDMELDGIGLFRYMSPGQIRNLRLKNVKILSDGVDVGAIVGRLGSGLVENCRIVNADITGNTRVGGLVGSADGMVTQCSSEGRVTGGVHVGGLVGSVGQGTVKRSYSKASVFGNDSVGGLIGITLNEATIVDACYASGSVKGSVYVGGLVGQLVAGRVYHCYSTGLVSGSQPVGGLVGSMKVLGDVIASFWDAETSGRTTSAGGMGRTTAEMWSSSTFTNWDFDGTWSICEGIGYPIFWWQIPAADLRCPDGVNGVDFAWFAVQWNRNDCGAVNWECDWTDFDGSGDVGFPDLAFLAEEWLTGTY